MHFVHYKYIQIIDVNDDKYNVPLVHTNSNSNIVEDTHKLTTSYE